MNFYFWKNIYICLKLIVISIIVSGISIVYCQATEFYPLQINKENFPKIEIKGLLINDEQYILPKKQNVQIRENNSLIENFDLTCSNKDENSDFSLLLLINLSSSMKSNYENIIRPTLVDIFDKYKLNRSEIAIMGYNNSGFLMEDFTNNKDLLISAMDKAYYSGTANIENALISDNISTLKILEKARNNKSILLITDGSDYGDKSNILDKFQQINTQIHSISINFNNSDLVKEICTNTNGFYNTIIGADRLKNQILAILNYEKHNNYCTYQYTSNSCNISNDLMINFDDLDYIFETKYNISRSQIPNLEITPNYHYYGVSQSIRNFTFTFRAINKDIKITGFSNSQNFKLSGDFLPISLPKGESKDITISYLPSDSNYIFEQFGVFSNLCKDVSINLAGGSDRTSEIDNTLKIIKPNGGENLAIGNKYQIEWQGVLPSDTVQIEYSTNNGNSWRVIANIATGLKYMWNNIPATPSNTCLLRISHLSKYDSRKNIISLKGIQGNVLNIIWKENNDELFTASSDGFIRLWNTLSGEPIKTISEKINNLKYISINYNYQYLAYLTNSSNKITIININNPSEEYSYELDNEIISSIEWNRNSNIISATTENQNLYIWDFPQKNLIKKIELSNPISTIKWDISGEKLAIGTENGAIYIWNRSDNSTIEIKSSDQKINSIDFNPTSKVIIASSNSEQIRVWDIDTKSNITNFNNDNKPVNIVSWDPKAKYIASTSIDSAITLWNPGIGTKFYTFKANNNIVNRIAWRGDGEFIASSTNQSEVLIWKISDIPFSRPILQDDTSDNVWAISNANIITKNIVFPAVTISKSRDTIVEKIIQNSSASDIQIDSIFVKNLSESFELLNELPEFPFILKSNSYLDFKVRFSPKNNTNYTDTIVFFTGARAYQSILNGEGKNALIKVEPAEYDFGTVKLAQKSEKLVATITNLSDSPININSINEIYNSNSQFKIEDFEPIMLNSHSSSNFSIIFTPNKFFSSGACFDIDYEGKIDNDYINLLGVGAAPQILVEKVFNLPTNVCDEIYTRKIKIYNIGNEILNISEISLLNSDRFSFDFTNTNFAISENDSTEFILIFTPKFIGTFRDTIVITSEMNADKSIENYIEINSQKEISSFGLTQNNLQFYAYETNFSLEKEFYIYNRGTVPLSWEDNIDLDKFKIKSINPIITEPMDSSLVIVEFLGASGFGEFNEDYIFEDSCNNQITLNLYAYVGDNLAQIECDSILIFPKIVCNDGKKRARLQIHNSGSTPLYIENIINSNHTNAFNIINSYEGVSIPQGSDYALEIEFNPLNLGNSIDTLFIISNAINVENYKPVILSGLWEKSDFRIIPDELNYDEIFENEIIHNYFEIQNTGNIDLLWSELPHSDIIIIDSIAPQLLYPNDTAKVYFTFLGGEYSKIYSEDLIFNNQCNSSDTIKITINVNGNPKIAIKIGDKIAKVRDTIELPIIIYSLDENELPEVDVYHTTISYNSTIMVPIDNNRGYVQGGKRIINYDFKAHGQRDSIRFLPRFLVTLGNSDSSLIELSNSTTISDRPIRLFEINGTLKIDSSSTDDGSKLVAHSGILRLEQCYPNPADYYTNISFSTIEQGNHSLIINDLLGYTIFQKDYENLAPSKYDINISTSLFPIGNYIYRLVTPSQQLIRKMTITR